MERHYIWFHDWWLLGAAKYVPSQPLDPPISDVASQAGPKLHSVRLLLVVFCWVCSKVSVCYCHG
jgi:hypothetical protein